MVAKREKDRIRKQKQRDRERFHAKQRALTALPFSPDRALYDLLALVTHCQADLRRARALLQQFLARGR
jgi:hypothetical protein